MVELTLSIGGQTLRFYDFANIPNARGRIDALGRYFGRMPATHLNVLDPFVLVDILPGHRRHSGGYYDPGDVDLWLNAAHTGISAHELIHLGVGRSQDRGIIGITTEAMLSDLCHYTVIHEAAHSVDYHLGLVPSGTTLEDLQGVTYPRESVGEYTAEAYARFIIHPGRICRARVLAQSGEAQRDCSRRLIAVLRRSAAFHSLPPDWLPT